MPLIVLPFFLTEQPQFPHSTLIRLKIPMISSVLSRFFSSPTLSRTIFSLMHHQDTVPIFQCIAQVVRYHNRRHFLFPDDLIRQLHDNFRCSGIQCRRMLIQNQEINRCHRRHQQRQYLTPVRRKGNRPLFPACLPAQVQDRKASRGTHFPGSF